MGTTDLQPLIFKTNGVERARFTGTSQFLSQVPISTPEAQAAIFSYLLQSGFRITVKGVEDLANNETGLQHDFPSPNLKSEYVGTDGMGQTVGFRTIYEFGSDGFDNVKFSSIVPGSLVNIEADRFSFAGGLNAKLVDTNGDGQEDTFVLDTTNPSLQTFVFDTDNIVTTKVTADSVFANDIIAGDEGSFNFRFQANRGRSH